MLFKLFSNAPIFPGNIDQHIQLLGDDRPRFIEFIFINMDGDNLAEKEIMITYRLSI